MYYNDLLPFEKELFIQGWHQTCDIRFWNSLDPKALAFAKVVSQIKDFWHLEFEPNECPFTAGSNALETYCKDCGF